MQIMEVMDSDIGDIVSHSCMWSGSKPKEALRVAYQTGDSRLNTETAPRSACGNLHIEKKMPTKG